MIVDFQNGFTAITGESGTGKSIILDAIDFCFGKLKNKNIRKNITKNCEISLTFEKIKNPEKVEDFINISIKNKPIVIKKILKDDEKISLFINNIVISQKQLKELMKYFLEIDEQSSTILEAQTQAKILDKFLINFDKSKELTDLLSEVCEFAKKIKENDRLISQLSMDAQFAKRDKNYLEQIIEELNPLNLKENEETELLEKRTELSKLCSSNNSIKNSLEVINSTALESKLNQILKFLERVETQQITPLKQRLNSIILDFSDVSFELSSMMENLHYSEEELIKIDDRLSNLRTLARKYNTSPALIFEFLNESKAKIISIKNYDSKLNELEKSRSEFVEKYKNAAHQLSIKRKAASKKLSDLVMQKLSDLLMPNAVFKIEIFSNENFVSEYGIDIVEFQANFNQKENLLTIDKIASGGESARLNFALKTITGTFGNSNTIIFDEIDIGLGGATAYAMGKVMKTFSLNNLQVISITHSAQVASKADFHLLIKKHIANGNINVECKSLNDSQRQTEIARMISGDDINEEAIKAASKLIFTKE